MPFFSIIRNTLTATSLIIVLAGCGGGGSNSSHKNDHDDGPPSVEPAPEPPRNEGDNPAPDPKPDPDPKPQPDPDPKPQPEPDPEPVNKSAHLRWETPLTRLDDSCLQASDLTAYRVSYGLSPKDYSHSIEIPVEELNCSKTGAANACGQPQACNYIIEDLESASWYFAVQAVDQDGKASDFSNEAIKTIE